MKCYRIAFALVLMIVAGAWGMPSFASGLTSEAGEKDILSYTVSTMGAYNDYTVSHDGVLLLTKNSGCEERSAKANLSAKEFDALKKLITSDAFKQLQPLYVTEGRDDADTIEFATADQHITIENHESPEVIKKLVTMLKKLEKKYLKSNDKLEAKSLCQH